jgi:uncharacterized cofD-like protein
VSVRHASRQPSRLASRPRRVTVVGGGTGSFNLLSGLKDYDVSLQSIVTMMDSGGDSGELRDAFGVLPPGDVRRCLVALSDESEVLRDLFSFRFDEAPLAGRNFGNLFILALSRALGSDERAIDAIGKILKIRGRVLPVTWDHSHLHAELEDGRILRGEGTIDSRAHRTPRSRRAASLSASLSPIRRVYLAPPADANPEALRAFADADAIVLAPGDVFTSTVPNLLVRGVAAAIRRAKAPLVYVVNLMTKSGETDGWTASRHVEQIARYAGRVPDGVLVHRGAVPRAMLRRYQTEHAARVVVDAAALRRLGVRTIRSSDLACTTSVARHDPARTARALMSLLGACWDARGRGRRSRRATPRLRRQGAVR